MSTRARSHLSAKQAGALATAARRQQAESRLMVIRNALEVADAELARALAERDWEVYNLASFADYCAEKLPDLQHIKLRVDARRARTRALIDAAPDVTEREIAAATGASPATAHRDVLAVTGRSASNEASPTPPVSLSAGVSNVDRAVAWVAARGARGLTYIELCERTSWRGGQATGALSEAKRRGLIVPSGAFRDGCSVYVRP